jgi:hypothetical protein
MPDLDKTVAGIHMKVKQLIDLNSSLAEENLKLRNKQETIENKVKDQKIFIEQLIEKNNYLKIAKSVKQSEGNTDVKKKIDELVREIDKCIGLLNK